MSNKTIKNKVLAFATGRRKCAIAKVQLVAGKGKIITSGKGTITPSQKQEIMFPLSLIDKDKQYDVVVESRGGGIQGMIDATKLAIARAIVVLDGETKTILRKNGLLTRDNRVKERKKPGLRRARRAPQWAKR